MIVVRLFDLMGDGVNMLRGNAPAGILNNFSLSFLILLPFI